MQFHHLRYLVSDLIRAIRVNEGIKRVMDASRQISLVALNALLTSRQAGARSVGFAVVARQLRSLAQDLEQTMGTLNEAIARLVAGITGSMQDVRLLSYVRAIRGRAEPHPPCLERMYESMSRRVKTRQSAVDADWLLLDANLRRALRLSAMGRVLARNAKIEAAHGGEMVTALTMIANQIEKSVEEIAVSLRGLRGIAVH